MSEVKDLLVRLNIWSDFGFVGVGSHEDYRGSLDSDEFQLSEGDVIVTYDWMNDDMTPQEKDDFSRWMYDNGGFHDTLRAEMAKLGYEQVADLDGSSDGLYYGAEVFRK